MTKSKTTTKKAVTTDSLKSLESGLGSDRDKSVNVSFYSAELQRDQIDAMYDGNWMAAKAVDIPAFDSCRAWRAWQADEGQLELIETEEKRLDIQGKTFEAMVNGRLYGGGALVMGVGNDDPAKELKLESIGKGDLRYVHVVDRYDLTEEDIRRNPEDPWYGEPVAWIMNTETQGSVRIHPSRVVPMLGKRRPRRAHLTKAWGNSLLQAMVDDIKHATLANQSVASLLPELKVDIIKIPDLMEHLSTEDYTARLTQRLRRAMSIKSTVNALVLDSQEEYEQKQISFANLPETIQQYLVIVAGAADIPVVRFLSQSPGGLNASGDSDLKNYYDRISAEQAITISPRLHRLDEVMIRSATGRRDPSVHSAWNPLYQTSEKEASEIEDKRASTYTKIGASGLVPGKPLAKALVNSMIESGRYPGIEAAMEEYESETGEFDPDAVDPEAEEDPDAEGQEAKKPAAKKPAGKKPQAKQVANDATPRTLYVHRKVLNGAAIIKWAKAQGFKSTLKAAELHVTIAFSRTPVDWMKAGATWSGDDEGKLTVRAGGPRVVEALGPNGAVVLHFACNDLIWRHEDIRRSSGATWEWTDYQPHMTITYEGNGFDLSKVEPYTGKIELGPEIFSEVVDDWKKGKG